MNKVFSIKSGKSVGSGKVVLLIFLTVLISRQKAISVFGLNGLGVRVFNLLILECPLTLERSEINRKPTFPPFPQGGGERDRVGLQTLKGIYLLAAHIKKGGDKTLGARIYDS
jgi:hypothetical protein